MKVNNPLVWVFGIAILLRLLLWSFQVAAPGDDGERYYAESKNLVEHGVFSSDRTSPPAPTAHDMPLWPGTMAGILWITDSKPLTVRISGLLTISLMTCAVWFIVSLLGREPFHCSTGGKALAAGVMFFMPEAIPYSLFYMPDAMMLFFLCGALNLFFKGIYERRVDLLASSVLFGFAILSKPISLPIAGAFFVALLFVLPTSFLKRILWVCACFILVGAMLSPWMLRNKAAFGQAGLTTISGTNLYKCNWKWMVKKWPEPQRTETMKANQQFEDSLADADLMTQSKAMGKYAKEQILTHFKEYVAFTLQRHPRLYFGTGTIAVLRYLGLEGACAVLEDASGGGTSVAVPTQNDKVIAWGMQGLSFVILGLAYCVILVGFLRGGWAALKSKSLFSLRSIAFLSAFGGVLLLAIVIGPITATRYRLAMIPFFAILASMAFLLPKRQPEA